MKKLSLTVALLISIATIAQPTFPGKKSIENKIAKRANKAVDEILNGNEPVKAKTASPDVTVPEEETKSAAKSYINGFWKQIEKMKNHEDESNKQVVYYNALNSARTAINNTKTKDPAYNTEKMEQALRDYEDAYNSIGKAKGNLRENRIATMNNSETLLKRPYIFEKAAVNIGGTDTDNKDAVQKALEASDAVIKEYNKQVQDFWAGNPEKIMYQNDQSQVATKAKAAEGYIKKAEDVYKNYRTLASVAAYQDLIICKNFIEGAKKFFPNEPALNENAEKLNKALQQYESRESFMNKMAANKKEYIKNLRMGKAVMSNPTLEKTAKQAYENAAISSQKYTVSKVNIVSEWRLEKNELGIPLHKEVYVNMAIKLADGQCGIAVGWLRQEYEGGGTYSAARLILPSPVQELPCENLQ